MSKRASNRVIFVNEASSLIGMGHLLRSLVLAKVLFSRGYDISGITIGEEKAVLYAEERTKIEQFTWPIQTRQDYQSAVDSILHEAPSLVVVDCAQVSQSLVRACAISGIPTVALDYFVAEQPLPAAVINLIDHNSAAIAGHPPSREGVDYWEGPQYAIIRDEFLEGRQNRTIRGESDSIKNILIAFGGADPSGNTQRALEILFRWPGEFFVDMIVGPLFSSEIDRLVDWAGGKCVIRKHFSPNYMGKLFEDADLLFCGGGGTLLEAMCVGVPAIVIAQNAAELRHATTLAQRDACWLVDQAGWDIVSQCENRLKKSKSAQACVDGRGAERICDVIEKQLNLG